MSSQLTPENQLENIINLVKLALPQVGGHLTDFNLKDKTLNLLLEVENNVDTDKINSVILPMTIMLKFVEISIVKLYRIAEKGSKPECFSILDLNQDIKTDEENPFSQVSLLNQKYENNTISSPLLKSDPNVNPNLGIKQRASLGDVQAIKQLLDLVLIHRNATTSIQLEGKFLKVAVESEEEPDQQTTVLIIRRQLELLKNTVFTTTEISGKKKGERESWHEVINFKPVIVQSSNKFIDAKLQDQINKINKFMIVLGGVVLLVTVIFSFLPSLRPNPLEDPQYLATLDAIEEIKTATIKGVGQSEYRGLVNYAFSKMLEIPETPQELSTEKQRLARAIAFYDLASQLWECQTARTYALEIICFRDFYQDKVFSRDFPWDENDPLIDEIRSTRLSVGLYATYGADPDKVIQELWKRAEL